MNKKMKFKRVLICILPFLKEIPKTPFIGVGYISEYLSYNNVENTVFDMNLRYSVKQLFKRIKEFKPDLIGFFLMTKFFLSSYEIIKKVKQKFKIPCVAGGPHVSTFRKNFLKKCDIDFAVKLEGEITLMELINGKKPANILGLLYKENGIVYENDDRPFIKNLDKIPFPKYKKFELTKYKDKAISIISSRGCPFQCIYCPVNVAIGKKFRTKSANNIYSEIKYWYNKGYRKIKIQDDNFTLEKKRVLELCQLLIKNRRRDLVFTCPTGVRADRIDREILTYMKKAGFITIAIGVEGGNNKTLKTLKKGESIEEIEEKIALACEIGFDVILYFLIGAPGETEKDVIDSFQLALKYPVTEVFFYSIIPFPATELYEWIKKKKLFLAPLEQYLNTSNPYGNIPYFVTKELPYDKRVELLKKSKKISEKIRKRGIIRRFRHRYGFFGWIVAIILSSNFIFKQGLNNRFFLRLYTKYLVFITKHE